MSEELSEQEKKKFELEKKQLLDQLELQQQLVESAEELVELADSVLTIVSPARLRLFKQWLEQEHKEDVFMDVALDLGRLADGVDELKEKLKEKRGRK